MSQLVKEQIARSERSLDAIAEFVASGLAPAAVTRGIIATARAALENVKRAHAAAIVIPESRPRARGRAIAKLNAAMVEVQRAVLPIGIGLGSAEAVAIMAECDEISTKGRE